MNRSVTLPLSLKTFVNGIEFEFETVCRSYFVEHVMQVILHGLGTHV